MGKFGALAADISKPFRVYLLDPVTDQRIKDKDGNEAYVEVYSIIDSDRAIQFDKEHRTSLARRARRTEDEDNIRDFNAAKLARLTAGWHLVDPATGETIEVDCTEANAEELYSDPGAGWVFRQALLGASDTANFFTRSPKT